LKRKARVKRYSLVVLCIAVVVLSSGYKGAWFLHSVVGWVGTVQQQPIVQRSVLSTQRKLTRDRFCALEQICKVHFTWNVTNHPIAGIKDACWQIC
jgi:hypothetical protein